MMKLIDKVLLNIEEIILIVLFTILPILCFLQVITRYILEVPVPWSEEAMRILFIWATFIGASLGVKRGAHLGVEVLVNLLPVKAKNLFMGGIGLICAAFCLFFAYNGVTLGLMEVQNDQVLPVSGIPTIYSTMAIPVGFAMMSIRFAMIGIEKWRTQNG
jgi:TRAP-type C4-dicarboxylate transport system permease small subunit